MVKTAKNIHRILVALDPGLRSAELSNSILQTAAKLARNLEAELYTLLIEDINLLQLAELPFAREVVYGSSVGRKLSVADMERSLHQQALRLHKLVETIAKQNEIKIAFDVIRGDVARELCSASQKTDLLVVGKNTQTVRRSIKLGSIAKSLLVSANCDLLLLQHGASIERPVTVLFTGSKASHKAMQLAVQSARQDHHNLSVVYPASDESDYQQLVGEVDAITKPHGFLAQHIQLKENSVTAMLDIIISTGARILLLDTGSEVLNTEQVQKLITQTNTPVILIN